MTDALALAFGTSDLSFLKKKKSAYGRAKRPVSGGASNAPDYRDKGYMERTADAADGSLRQVFPQTDFRFSDDNFESSDDLFDDSDTESD